MNLTKRDRFILLGVVALGLVAAYWFLALAPKRDKLGSLDKELATAKQTLAQSEQEKAQFAQAQVQFPTLYAGLGRLGKAVPAGQETPSLLLQLNDAATRAGVDFRSIELKLDLTEKLAAAASATDQPAAPPGGAATGATGASGATGAAGTTTTVAATGATTAPTGAGTGALQPLPFQYKFRGSFYNLEGLVHNVTRLVQSRNRQLAITGRLVVVQGFALKRRSVTIVATSYMLPADQGLFAGATPAGPAGVTAATPQPASGGTAAPTPPTAAVTP